MSKSSDWLVTARLASHVVFFSAPSCLFGLPRLPPVVNIDGYRKSNIPCDDDGKGCDFENDEQGDAREQEDVFHFVAFPSPLLEFEGKHRDFGNEQIATHKHHEEEQQCHGRRRLEKAMRTYDE